MFKLSEDKELFLNKNRITLDNEKINQSLNLKVKKSWLVKYKILVILNILFLVFIIFTLIKTVDKYQQYKNLEKTFVYEVDNNVNINDGHVFITIDSFGEKDIKVLSDDKKIAIKFMYENPIKTLKIENKDDFCKKECSYYINGQKHSDFKNDIKGEKEIGNKLFTIKRVNDKKEESISIVNTNSDIFNFSVKELKIVKDKLVRKLINKQ